MDINAQLLKLKALRQLASSLSECSVLAHRAERLDIERSVDRLGKLVSAAVRRKNRRIMQARCNNAPEPNVGRIGIDLGSPQGDMSVATVVDGSGLVTSYTIDVPAPRGYEPLTPYMERDDD